MHACMHAFSLMKNRIIDRMVGGRVVYQSTKKGGKLTTHNLSKKCDEPGYPEVGHGYCMGVFC